MFFAVNLFYESRGLRPGFLVVRRPAIGNRLNEKQLRGERLAAARKRKGLTQAALAAALGYSDHTMIGHVEQGKKNMSARMWTAAARVLDVSVDYLDCYETKMERAVISDHQDETPIREITPEEAVANFRLILDEPMLALTVRRGSLSIEDMADIAEFIRSVQSERDA